MGGLKDASTPLRAASDDLRCDGSPTKSGDGPLMDDSDESLTNSGIVTPTTSHDDTPADGGDYSKEASDLDSRLLKKFIASRLVEKFALQDFSQPATDDMPCFTEGSSKQLLEFWKRCVAYASSPLPAAYWLRIESMVRDYGKKLFRFKEEFWYTRHCADLSKIYSGANVRCRPALISTARGFKHVRGAVISQFSTAPEQRRRGHGTEFLKRLAEEMDRREGEDRIEFSVVYGGPNTNFLKKRG
ncbi:hypothetical protein CCMA1212_007146 [Trichoderma ghanense]|uniref:N-acetyltransferase domain-containing protein n=1 Tax=Trichoderma ghanense TaxID=65468 RepID=A0ABY2GYC1_9HYPO